MQHIYFIDRLRVVLTALVVLHHTAITYGGSGGWLYREVTDEGRPSSLLLTVFCAVNQSFFMGMFFLFAGYFTPQAWARKPLRQFVQDRLLRLGVPLLVFGFVLGPLTLALGAAAGGGTVVGQWLVLLKRAAFVIGPLWFAWALLLFTAAYVLLQLLLQLLRTGARAPTPASDPDRAVPPTHQWLLAALGVGAVALALRQLVPVGQNVWGLQLGYFASYAFLFALGCTAAKHRWLERVPRGQAKLWRRVSLLTMPVLFVVAAFSGALKGQAVNFNGGLGLPAVAYAFWEPFVAWGLIATLLVSFEERYNTPSPRWQRWGTQAFGAFVLHPPVLLGLSVALAEWAAPPLVKFVVVGAAAVLASFAAAALLLKLPGVQRVM